MEIKKCTLKLRLGLPNSSLCGFCLGSANAHTDIAASHKTATLFDEHFFVELF
jgi:hypothetical protein